MSFKTDLVAYQRRVDAELERLFVPRNELAEDRVWNASCHAIHAGGKRLRPILCMTTAELGGDKHAERALRAGIAIEMLHTYSLVHDDLPAMDDADTRRGKPSVHVAFDEATGILAGDTLLTLAFEHMAPLGSDLVIGLAKASGVEGMIGGQMLDIMSEQAGGAMDQATLERLQAKKTGALIAFSVAAGGMVAGLEDSQQSALLKYGQQLGLAFQVWDDVLDETQDAETLGKPAGADAAAEKSTFVSLLGLDGARAFAASIIEDARTTLKDGSVDHPFLGDLANYVIAREN